MISQSRRLYTRNAFTSRNSASARIMLHRMLFLRTNLIHARKAQTLASKLFQKHEIRVHKIHNNRNAHSNASNIPPTQNAQDRFQSEKHTWAEKYVPQSILPYIQIARLNRPAGIPMLLWPCVWSITLAATPGHMPDLKLLSLFALGSIIMRGAGCTINDMWDKKYDTQVERTNKRPLAAGSLSYPQAYKFLALQLSAGLAVLLQLNYHSIALGASSLALVVTYPLMKRITYWPQAFLGLTFNYGAILGYTAVHASACWPIVLPLYLGGVCWTIVYDTLYAHQDKADDVRIGVRSTAILFGEHTKPIINLFSILSIAGIGLAGYHASLAWPFYMGLTSATMHLMWQVNTAKVDDPSNLQLRFASNNYFGAIVAASIFTGKILL